MYHFNWRTVRPLETSTSLGYDKPTSRCQTKCKIRTSTFYKPVIPSVPFIHRLITKSIVNLSVHYKVYISYYKFIKIINLYKFIKIVNLYKFVYL